MVITEAAEHQATGDLVLMQYMRAPVNEQDRRQLREILAEASPGGEHPPTTAELNLICRFVNMPFKVGQFILVNEAFDKPVGFTLYDGPTDDLLRITALVLRPGFAYLASTVLESFIAKRPYVTFTCPERQIGLQLAMKRLGFKAIKVYPQFFGESEEDGFLFLKKPRDTDESDTDDR